MRFERWTTTALLLAATFAGTCGAQARAAVRASQPIRLPNTPYAVAGEAGGGVLAATGDLVSGAEPTRLGAIGNRGVTGRSTTLVPRVHTGVGEIQAAFTSTDVLAAYPRTDASLHQVVVASAPRRGGAVTTTVISTPGRLASAPQLVTGGSAAGVLSRERTPGGTPQMMWAYRSPGAPAFTPPIVVDGADVQHRSRYFLALGPDGSGAIVKMPELPIHPRGVSEPVLARRANADGTLGPWVTIAPAASFGDAKLTVAADGTVVIAMSVILPNAVRPKGPADSIFAVTSLLPGAAASSPLQTLETDVAHALYVVGDYSVAAASRGHVIVASDAAQTQHSITVFDGPADGLVRRQRFTRSGAISPLVTFTRDGGVTLIWRSFVGLHSSTITAVHRRADGPYSAPRIVARPRQKESIYRLNPETEPEQLVPLGGGDAALTYTDDGSDRYDDYLVRLRP